MYLHFAPVQKSCSSQRQADGIADEGPVFDSWGGIVTTCLRKFPARKPRCIGKGNATRVQSEGHDFAGPAYHEGVRAQAKAAKLQRRRSIAIARPTGAAPMSPSVSHRLYTCAK